MLVEPLALGHGDLLPHDVDARRVAVEAAVQRHLEEAFPRKDALGGFVVEHEVRGAHGGATRRKSHKAVVVGEQLGRFLPIVGLHERRLAQEEMGKAGVIVRGLA